MRAGAFGSVSKTRYEVLLQGTRDELPTADAEWREYDFVAKPGAPERRPPLLSPYHLRLDWLLWFLPFSGWRTHPWLAHLTAKLLSNDATASSLLRENPFDGGVAIPARPSPHAHPRTPMRTCSIWRAQRRPSADVHEPDLSLHLPFLFLNSPTHPLFPHMSHPVSPHMS